MKRLYIFATLMMASVTTWAYDFTYNGIYFDVVNSTSCEVVEGEVQYSKNVVIPDTVEFSGKKLEVIRIAAEAFNDCKGLTAVTIPETVTSIGERAFYGCRKLTAINIPSAVTSIYSEAFAMCSKLKKVYVGWDNFDNRNFGSGIFSVNDDDVIEATLYIPEGTKELYESRAPWNEFKSLSF